MIPGAGIRTGEQMLHTVSVLNAISFFCEYFTPLCRWKDGRCSYGDSCKYAHGEAELRANQMMADQMGGGGGGGVGGHAGGGPP